MVLRFLAIERIRHVTTAVGEGDRDGGHERNALVCRPEQHVERHVRFDDRFRVELRERFQRCAVVKQPCIEKIRRNASCLGRELAETQDLLFDGKADELLTKIGCQPRSRVARSAERNAPVRVARSMLRIITLNVNGIRSAARKGFVQWLARARADVVCVQELKAQSGDITKDVTRIGRLKGHFHCAEKKGYSGVGLYTRHTPLKVVEGIGISEIDREGRYLRVDYENLSVISLYQPSGSSGEERQRVKFKFMRRFFPHLKRLRAEGREIVLCGDWNIAHTQIDLRNWRSNQKNSGFLPGRARMAHARVRGARLGRRIPARRLPAGPVHVVVEPGTGLGEECRMAHRLPDRDARHRSDRAALRDIQGRAVLGPRAAHDRLWLHVGIGGGACLRLGPRRALCLRPRTY